MMHNPFSIFLRLRARSSPSSAILGWMTAVVLSISLLFSFAMVEAANTVNISTNFQSSSICYNRMRQVNDATGTSSSELADIADITTTLQGCVAPPTALLSDPSSVVWASVLPANLTLTNYSSNASWIQPSYFPSTAPLHAAAVSQTYARLRQDCIVSCASQSPASTAMTIYLAYGRCYCGTALPAATSLSNLTVVGCCVPLPTAGVANFTDATTLVPKGPECVAGRAYGLLMSVSFDCQLNASFCSSSATACTVKNGCCASNTASGGGGSSTSLEAAAAQWLVALLLIAVVVQVGYWVIKLRMCRRHPPDVADRRNNNNVNQRGRRRLVLGGEALEVDDVGGQDDINEEMMAQLNGIAQRMRIALLRQQQRAEPRRTKDEALDAAMEALALFAICPEDSLDPEECCPMCLDELRSQACVRVLCSHVIHRECMKEFLAHKLVSYQAPVTCPMCRAVVLLQNSASFHARYSGSESAVVDMETPMVEQRRDEMDAMQWEAMRAHRRLQDSPRRRPRSHSRGRRFRVAQANMAVERLLERRHPDDEETEMYQPPQLVGAAAVDAAEVLRDPGPSTNDVEENHLVAEVFPASARDATDEVSPPNSSGVSQEPTDAPPATFTVNDL